MCFGLFRLSPFKMNDEDSGWYFTFHFGRRSSWLLESNPQNYSHLIRFLKSFCLYLIEIWNRKSWLSWTEQKIISNFYCDDLIKAKYLKLNYSCEILGNFNFSQSWVILLEISKKKTFLKMRPGFEFKGTNPRINQVEIFSLICIGKCNKEIIKICFFNYSRKF